MTKDTDALVFEYALDAPPEKIWRALTVPEYLDLWLKEGHNSIALSVVTAEENKLLTYRWRDSGQGIIAGVEDSLVTFELAPMVDGGTWLRLTHAPLAVPTAANNNHAPMLMVA